MKNKSIRNDNAGFSLVELIVVILILAIIGSGAVLALGSIYSTKVTAVAKNVNDALKQVRVSSLALENEDISDDVTEVYAKFYLKDSKNYVDCIKNEKQDDGSRKENVFKQHELGSDLFKIQFEKVDTSALSLSNPNAGISSWADLENYIVYVYFKKSTGGIASIRRVPVSSPDSTGDIALDVKQIKVINTTKTTDYETLIVVPVTGRCYIDS